MKLLVAVILLTSSVASYACCISPNDSQTKFVCSYPIGAYQLFTEVTAADMADAEAQAETIANQSVEIDQADGVASDPNYVFLKMIKVDCYLEK